MKYRNDNKEVATKVLEHLEGELEDICKYNCLYEMLVEREMYEEAEYIEKIASDEWRHADRLWSMLGKFDINIPQKIEELWDKVEEIFEE